MKKGSLGDTLVDVEEAVRVALENLCFEVGSLDVQLVPAMPAERTR